MKPFKSSIAQQLEAYVAYRRNLGFSDKHLRSMLRPFDRFLEETGLSIQGLNPLDFVAFMWGSGTPFTFLCLTVWFGISAAVGTAL